MLLTFTVCGVGGNIASIIMNDNIHIGAFPALFGMIGALFTIAASTITEVLLTIVYIYISTTIAHQ
jgi:membrane associated rhomboid family serine protease